MPALSFPPLETLVPHRETMLLIDEVASCDYGKGELVAAFSARRGWCENWAAIEYMAQGAAALAGIADRQEGWQGAPRPGFLLGTRKLELDFERFEPGRRYTVHVQNAFRDADAASFVCEIFDGEKRVAAATLNAYRPPDVGAFLSAASKA